jgi:uncharacterized membrane protein required for colicin V production
MNLPYGANWYDAVVAAALLWGVWSGVRTGLSGEILRVAGWVLTVALAVRFYPVAGGWLKQRTALAAEVANLVAFVSIAVAVYLVSVAVRLAMHRWMTKLKLTATLENLGGGVAGVVRMAVVMACVTLMLCLLRSPFWHEQVGKNSRFGSYVVGRFPAVAAMLEKNFPETLWMLKDFKRRPEPAVEDGGAAR